MDSEEDELPSHQTHNKCFSVARSVLDNYGGLKEECNKAFYIYKSAVGLAKQQKTTMTTFSDHFCNKYCQLNPNLHNCITPFSA